MTSIDHQTSNSQIIDTTRSECLEIGEHDLTLGEVVKVSTQKLRVELTPSPAVRGRVEDSCRYINQAVADREPIYGVTSGFGGMADIAISPEEAADLQQNLVAYHRVGAGDFLPTADVRAAMLIRARSHLKGVSGIRLELIQRIVDFLNADATPRVRELGSIGASGDLTPLAYITGSILGEQRYQVDFQGEVMSASDVLSRMGLEPMTLLPKEGLAMMNGTSVMTGMAARIVFKSRRLLNLTMGVHGLVMQGLGATNQSFHPFIAANKKHPGQVWAASTMLDLLDGSKLIRDELDGTHDYRDGQLIQDRYSLRCLSQFIAPIAEGVDRISDQVEIEMNSATDNPLIDADGATSYHGGNFLGQHIGMGMDQLRHYIGMLAKHLDTQLALLVEPGFNNGLSASLRGNEDRAVNMGLKGLQITANSIMPMLSFLGNSIADRFPTHAEQFNQNINSQGFASANLARQSVDLFERYLAVALIFGVQSVDLRNFKMNGSYNPTETLSPVTRRLYSAVKTVVAGPATSSKPLIWNDGERDLDECIDLLTEDISSGDVIHAAFGRQDQLFT